MRILALDGSINTCGWATVDISDTDAVFKWGMFALSGLNFVMKCHDLKDCIAETIGDYDEIVIEWVVYEDSQRGQVAARQGHLFTLAGIVMFIVGASGLPASKIHLYTHGTWAGNISKDITGRRFFKQFGVNYLKVDHNAVDATMMLLHHCKTEGLVA